MGKGSKRRPQQIDDEIMDLRWKMAFGTDEERKDAQARLSFLEWQEARINNPHLWGEDNENSAAGHRD